MKKLTLILSMLIALVGLNANAAMYIVGNNPFGDWHTYAGEQMTDNGNGIYTYVTNQINGTVWFVFADNLTTGTSDDWNTFNGNYRYGPLNSGQAITAGTEYTTQKSTNGNASYSFAGTAGESYQFTFDTNTMKFKIEGYVAPIEFTSFTVAGNDVDIFGEAWNPELTQNDMTLDPNDGVYKLSKKGIEMAAGDTLEYKVVANHSWDNNWGETFNGENKKEYFVEDGIYDITFFFDPENEVVAISTALIAPVEYTSFTVVGNNVDIFGEAWNPELTQNDMTLDPNDGVYKLSKQGIQIPADYTLEYKVAANHSWKFNWGETFIGDNKTEHFEQSGIYDMTFFFDLENEYVTISTVKVGELPEPTVDDVYIIGDVNNTGWSATEGVKMAYNEGIYTAQITTQNQGDLGVGYFGFTKKLADPESETDVWEQIAAYRFGPVSEDAFVMTKELLNVNCDLATDGSYNSIAIPAGTWTVTVDLVNNKFAINGEWPSVEPEHYDGDVYIMGEVNDNGGWFTNKGVKMTRDAENNVYTATITTAGENEGYSYFSFTKQLAEGEADWEAIAPYRFGAVTDGNPFLVTEELLNQELALVNNADPRAFQIEAGEWNLTLSVDNMTLVITKVEGKRGDVNGDDGVNIADVTSLIDYLLSGNAEGVVVGNADCNIDQAVNIADVTALIDYLLSGAWAE